MFNQIGRTNDVHTHVLLAHTGKHPNLSLDVIWRYVFIHLHWFVSVFGTLTAVFRWQVA